VSIETVRIIYDRLVKFRKLFVSKIRWE